jgi:hypothetical protein
MSVDVCMLWGRTSSSQADLADSEVDGILIGLADYASREPRPAGVLWKEASSRFEAGLHLPGPEL